MSLVGPKPSALSQVDGVTDAEMTGMSDTQPSFSCRDSTGKDIPAYWTTVGGETVLVNFLPFDYLPLQEEDSLPYTPDGIEELDDEAIYDLSHVSEELFKTKLLRKGKLSLFNTEWPSIVRMLPYLGLEATLDIEQADLMHYMDEIEDDIVIVNIIPGHPTAEALEIEQRRSDTPMIYEFIRIGTHYRFHYLRKLAKLRNELWAAMFRKKVQGDYWEWHHYLEELEESQKTEFDFPEPTEDEDPVTGYYFPPEVSMIQRLFCFLRRILCCKHRVK